MSKIIIKTGLLDVKKSLPPDAESGIQLKAADVIVASYFHFGLSGLTFKAAKLQKRI